jgi:hypothetical protein
MGNRTTLEATDQVVVNATDDKASHRNPPTAIKLIAHQPDKVHAPNTGTTALHEQRV